MTNARLEELRGKFQENPRRYFAPFANELRKAGDPAQAITVCRAHLATQPGHVSGHIVLGQALYEAGNADESRDVFTAALELDPENLIALRTLGEIAQVNGEFGTARQWYQRLLDADPRNSEVAQLLRDIPADAPAAPQPVASAPDPIEEPTPFTVRREAEAAEPAAPKPAPLFHTSFTGSNRAYDPDEPRPQPEPIADSHVDEPAAAAAIAPDEPFIDLDISAHEVLAAAPPRPAAVPVDEMELVDFNAVGDTPDAVQASAVEEPAEPVDRATPDETFELSASAMESENASFGPPAPEFEIDLPEASSPQPVVDESQSTTEFDPADLDETPRAVFAEHGFDGPADEDELGWITTPSAAYSDLEAAPEDWFETQAAAAPEDVAPDSISEPTPAESVTADHNTDSWFDDVGGASAIETTEVITDEFWLPPELPQVTAAEDNTRRPVEAEQTESTTVESTSDDAPPTWSAAESYEAEPEPAEQFVTAAESWSPSAEDAPMPVEAEAAEPFAATASEPHYDEPAPVEAERSYEEPQASVEAERSYEETQPPVEAELPYEEQAVSAAALSYEEQPPVEAERPYEEQASAAAAHDEFDVNAMADSADEVLLVEHPAGVTDASTGDEFAPPVPEFATSSSVDSPVEAEQHDFQTEPALASVDEETTSFESVPVIAHTPDSVEVTAGPTPAPFITETLADLYLRQGFREEALSIYRQLAQRNPGNQALAERIRTIELGEGAESEHAGAPSETRAAGQSVRSFFSRLARRQVAPGSVPAPAQAKAEPEMPFASAASALANMFAASRPNATDENAASTLSSAFTDPAGRPSRAAERELSLDHLFREVAPAGSEGGGVTLDEFYSTPDAAAGSPTESDATSDESSGSDIRQFTAWLEGLRKK